MSTPVPSSGALTEADSAPVGRPRGPSWGRLRWSDVLCGGALIAGIIASYVLLTLTPSMLEHHAVALEALTGNIASIVIGGAFARVGTDPLWLVVLAPLAGVLLYDVFYWWAGRLWGDQLLRMYAGTSPWRLRWLRRGERMVADHGSWALVFSYYLPIPNIVLQVLCGLSGMSLRRFLIADAIGTLAWEALLIGLGWELGQRGVHIAHEVNHYGLYVTIGLILVIVVATTVKTQRRRQPPIGSR